jgi:hypothetical protein
MVLQITIPQTTIKITALTDIEKAEAGVWFVMGRKDRVSRRLRTNDLLPGNNYHVSPPVHLRIFRGGKQLLPAQLL